MPLKRKLVQFAFLCIGILNVPSACFSLAPLSAGSGTHVEVGITDSLCPPMFLSFAWNQPWVIIAIKLFFLSFSEKFPNPISVNDSLTWVFAEIQVHIVQLCFTAALVGTHQIFHLFSKFQIFFFSGSLWFFAFWVPICSCYLNCFLGLISLFFFG